MKITDLKIYLAQEWRSFLFVEIETEAGITGIGESGLTGRELAVKGALEHFKPLLIGADAMRSEHHWHRLYRGGFFPAGPVLSSAISAIDLALWDIKGKVAGLPVYQLLGGKCRDRVMTYCHLHGHTPERVLDHARSARDAGWKCLRWEPPYGEGVIEPRKSVDRASEGFSLLRSDLGADIELAFDTHTRLGVADAIRLCRNVEESRPLFMEDCLRSEAAALYGDLRAATRVPLAAGEQFASKWQYKPLVENRWIDFARLDLCVGGGLTEARKIASWCETNLIDIAVHNPIGPVSTAACLHFNLALANFGVMELPRRPDECLADVFGSDIRWNDGCLTTSDRPGWGIDFKPDALENYAFTPTELPHLTRVDGSFTNW